MIILASSSPRRRELMESAGIVFEIIPSKYDEVIDEKIPANELVQELALNKALDVAKDHFEDFVIGADTIVVIDDTVLGKPIDRADAKRMLLSLSGRTHQVMTGIGIVYKGETERIVSIAEVTFKRLSDVDVERYLDSDEPYDKAGSYAIQGVARKFVERIEGDFFTIVGLPIDLIVEKLKKYSLK